MSNIYFTSDLHLGHKAAARLRGFDTVEKHDQHIAYMLMNTLVKRDVLWVLGDIAWHPEALDILDVVPCPMNAILGNHDNMDTQVYLKRFDWVGGAAKFKEFWLTHIPIHPQELFRAQANIHGHIHSYGATDNIGPPYINVNWDFWKRPLTLKEIREQVENWND